MAITDDEMIAALRADIDALNRGEFDAAVELDPPRHRLDASPGGLPAVQGMEALRAWMEPDAFESQLLELLARRRSGKPGADQATHPGRGAGSGIEMEIGAWSIWIFDENGQVTRVEIFLEPRRGAAPFRGRSNGCSARSTSRLLQEVRDVDLGL